MRTTSNVVGALFIFSFIIFKRSSYTHISQHNEAKGFWKLLQSQVAATEAHVIQSNGTQKATLLEAADEVGVRARAASEGG